MMTAETNDAGKAPMWTGLFLKFPNALEAVAKLSGQHETEKGDRWKIDGAEYRTNSMLRHLKAEAAGEVHDPDGLLHAAQVAWNALARLELILQDNFPQLPKKFTDGSLGPWQYLGRWQTYGDAETEFRPAADRRQGPRRVDKSIEYNTPRRRVAKIYGRRTTDLTGI